MAPDDPGDTAGAPPGLVLFAYDGSELAKRAIQQAGRQLAPGREALVLCVWQPVDVGFIPPDGRTLNAADAAEVRLLAQETAAQGASLAEQAGFRAQGIATAAAPTWKGIVAVAEERGAALIVFGAHRRRGLTGHLLGSVTAAVLAHSAACVLIVPGGAEGSG